MADPTVPAIFEGAFQFDGTLVRVDVLERGDQGWKLIEVKAASRVKSVHLEDLAVQTHVLRGNGLTLSGVSLMHVNRQYAYPGGGRGSATIVRGRRPHGGHSGKTA